MADFIDQLAHKKTRPRALEVLLIAHITIDRFALAKHTHVRMSHAARFVVNHVGSLTASMPVTPDLIFDAGLVLPEPMRVRAAQLTEDALALTVADVAFLSRDAVLAMMGGKPMIPSTKIGRLLQAAEIEANKRSRQ